MGLTFKTDCPFCYWEGTPQLTKVDSVQELFDHLEVTPDCAEAFDRDPEPLDYKDR